MGKIVHRYLLREVLTPFVLGLSIFTFVPWWRVC
jgi:lipopolysaccharide export LptBFGC system permease protein LptF